MCGILFVRSQNEIPLQRHLDAVKVLETRGPDFTRYQHNGNIFIAQTVLHITGSPEFYNRTSTDFFAFNGEIYNHKWFATRGGTDTELAYQAARDRPSKFRYFEGPWAWIYVDGEHFRYASDPQGERCLYRYQDADILIVASEVAAILKYLNLFTNVGPHTERHWPVRQQTPWRGIERIPAGVMFDHNGRSTKLDSIFDWKRADKYKSIEEASEAFDTLFTHVVRQMTPEEPYGLTFSGGLDSACLLAELPDTDHLYTMNMMGKDTVSPRVPEFLSKEQQQRLVQFDMTESEWGNAYVDVVSRTRMPVQSWSFVGQWHIARHCQERILFTGVGADELFGGYNVYQSLEYSTEQSVSPYSHFQREQATQEVIQQWTQCLDFYDGDPAPATLMMDYLTQIAAVDLRGVDVCTAAHGVEPRSPFVHPDIIKFALNLPWKYRVGIVPKPLIRNRFLRKWNQELVLPKQGFAGHCNDSAFWLDINVSRSPDRMTDWNSINQAGFIRWANATDRTSPV